MNSIKRLGRGKLMANCCMNTLIFYCDKEDNKSKRSLKKLFNSFVELREKYNSNLHEMICEQFNNQYVIPSFKRAELDYISENISALEESDNASFIVEIISAWIPIIRNMEHIVNMWNQNNPNSLINVVGIAEETGCDIYINTDKKGDFFIDRYKLVFVEEDNDESFFSDSFAASKRLISKQLREYGYHFSEQPILNTNNEEELNTVVSNIIKNQDLELIRFCCFKYKEKDDYVFDWVSPKE